ncbi:hypothetical protein GCM10019016_068870 [Streptomyces prasinosporus]|uniref:DUF4878 domain-containing protein n=1 Tax=Streptomyces prasinosporus TaxID=68256 RepID=A0ABP6TZB1_9ACTN|nr:hypothetical protein [Streptomyces viridodiastaticus]MCX4568699.1 hypothetical protein [Streptomyces viridodiastaticus]GHC01973.1 hypothetical protein GCM10010332_31780 [Streptomyces albogriseolus]
MRTTGHRRVIAAAATTTAALTLIGAPVQRRRLLAVAAALVVASGCSSQDDETPSSSASESYDGAREAVEAYVRALNSRSVTGLISVGGVEDAEWSRQEAERILADRGGRGWKIKDVRIRRDMGPDVGSARLLAEDRAGKPLRDTFTVTREKGAWHLTVFTGQPAEPGKESAATDEPRS